MRRMLATILTMDKTTVQLNKFRVTFVSTSGVSDAVEFDVVPFPTVFSIEA
jgi:hypothetical protein